MTPIIQYAPASLRYSQVNYSSATIMLTRNEGIPASVERNFVTLPVTNSQLSSTWAPCSLIRPRADKSPTLTLMSFRWRNRFISESSKLLLRKQEEWGQIVSPNAGAPWSSHHHSFARSDSHQRSCERMGSRKGFSIFGGRVPQSSALTRSELYWRQVVVEVGRRLAKDVVSCVFSVCLSVCLS